MIPTGAGLRRKSTPSVWGGGGGDHFVRQACPSDVAPRMSTTFLATLTKRHVGPCKISYTISPKHAETVSSTTEADITFPLVFGANSHRSSLWAPKIMRQHPPSPRRQLIFVPFARRIEKYDNISGCVSAKHPNTCPRIQAETRVYEQGIAVGDNRRHKKCHLPILLRPSSDAPPQMPHPNTARDKGVLTIEPVVCCRNVAENRRHGRQDSKINRSKIKRRKGPTAMGLKKRPTQAHCQPLLLVAKNEKVTHPSIGFR